MRNFIMQCCWEVRYDLGGGVIANYKNVQDFKYFNSYFEGVIN